MRKPYRRGDVSPRTGLGEPATSGRSAIPNSLTGRKTGRSWNLAFGRGIHFRSGAALAGSETPDRQRVLLLERLDNFRLDPQTARLENITCNSNPGDTPRSDVVWDAPSHRDAGGRGVMRIDMPRAFSDGLMSPGRIGGFRGRQPSRIDLMVLQRCTVVRESTTWASKRPEPSSGQRKSENHLL